MSEDKTSQNQHITNCFVHVSLCKEDITGGVKNIKTSPFLMVLIL